MKYLIMVGAAALVVTGCSTTSAPKGDPREKSTLELCRIISANPDAAYRQQAVKVLVGRKASVEKCIRLIQNDNSSAAAVAGVAIGVGAAAAASGGGYGGNGYATAWDQFYGPYGLMWRCRDMRTGQFVYDNYCYGKPRIDNTWPGWRAY